MRNQIIPFVGSDRSLLQPFQRQHPRIVHHRHQIPTPFQRLNTFNNVRTGSFQSKIARDVDEIQWVQIDGGRGLTRYTEDDGVEGQEFLALV